MYQSKLNYRFECNKEEDMTYLTVELVDNPNIWILKIECYKYIAPDRIERNRHNILNWMLHSPICDRKVNEEFINLLF